MKTKLKLNPEHQGTKILNHQLCDQLPCARNRSDQPIKKPSKHDYFRLKDIQDFNNALYLLKGITPVGNMLKHNLKGKLISSFSFEFPNSRKNGGIVPKPSVPTQYYPTLREI